MQIYKNGQTEIHYEESGETGKTPVIWAHGWGQSHSAFHDLVGSLVNNGQHFALDFPGFGESPPPEEIWGVDDYADALTSFIKDKGLKKVIWVGHSFGCRVGLQIASRHPDLIAGLFLIAAAGLKRYRPWHYKYIYLKARIYLFKFLKKIVPLGLNEEWLMKKFASTDYRDAGPMRKVMVKVINQDLSETARKVVCPVSLVYGENDTETPPDIGQRFHRLIKKSEIVILPGQDHYSVLTSGRHPVVSMLKKFIEKNGT